MKTSIDKEYKDSCTTHSIDWKDQTFINCDLRYFSLKSLGNDWEVILLDPPWRIKGNETGGTEKKMFTNS